MFRTFFVIALSFVAALYALRFERSRDLDGFATQLSILLDDSQVAEGEDGFALKSRVSRMNQAVYLIHRAEEQRIDLDRMFERALVRSGYTDAHRESLKDSLFQNWKLAHEFGLFSPANLRRMEEGEMPLITRGGYEGEEAVFDEFVPDFLAPEASTEFANLRYRPRPLSEQDEVLTIETLETATRLHHAQIVTSMSFRRVLTAFHGS